MADISKFGVALNGAKLGLLQPKMMFKWRALFYGIGFNADSRIITQMVQTVTRPKSTTVATELHSYNSVAYVQGKHKWEEVEMTFVDELTNGVVSVIGQQMQKQMNHFEQTTAVAGANFKFVTEIQTLDGTDAEELDSWRLDGCWITGMQGAEGDYKSSEMNIVKITIRYDVATHLAGANTNGGNTIGGDPYPNIPSPGGSAAIA